MKIKGVFIVILTAMLLTSCNKQKVYDSYQHTPVAGWERNDTLKFDDIERFKILRNEIHLSKRQVTTRPTWDCASMAIILLWA